MPARKTAARKAATRKKAPAKKGTSALVPASTALAPAGALNQEWQDKLAKYAKRDAATATGATGWPYIGTKNGVFRYNDEPLEELPPMLILGTMFENVFYEGDFDADNPTGPVCFALGRDEDGLAPPETLGKNRQCMQSEPAVSTCQGCWANAFNTADRGKGKACKNVRRLAMIPADRLDAKTLSEVEGAMLRIPVTSVKNYSTFANKVAKGLGVPLFMMRVRINIEPDTKSQFKVTFEPHDLVETDDGLDPMLINDPQLLGILETRVKEADTFLEQTPNVETGEATEKTEAPSRSKKAAAAGGRKKPAPRKAGSRKKTTRAAAGSKY